jgi:Type I restriction enzyme R protein N terminus (HSDR_N).
MTRITESAIEEFAINLLEKQSYQYLYGPDIAPDGDSQEREVFGNVLLMDRLISAAHKINPKIPRESILDAIRQIHALIHLNLSLTMNHIIEC